MRRPLVSFWYHPAGDHWGVNNADIGTKNTHLWIINFEQSISCHGLTMQKKVFIYESGKPFSSVSIR
jgi:hypothetical protein